jgi:uncharacterized integral membrane protein
VGYLVVGSVKTRIQTTNNQQRTIDHKIWIMPVMRIFLLLIIAIALGVLALSNWSPALALVFLGVQTPTLPLAVWIGGAIAAGALTSFFLQFLSYLQQAYAAPRVARPRNAASQAGWTRPEPPKPEPEAESDEFEEETDFTPPKTSSDRVASDWEESSEGDWNFAPEEESTSQGWQEQQEFRREPPQETVEAEPRDREQKRETKPPPQSSSTYSYGYREPKDSGVGKTEVVYDANYRVITPPYRNLEELETRDREEEEDEEDWGFDFNENEEEGFDRQSERGDR